MARPDLSRGYANGAQGHPRVARYSHLGGPAAGNSKVQDEAARRRNAPGGPPDWYPVGTQNPRRPILSQFAPEADAVNDQRWFKDRHAFVYTGTERTGRMSGLCDPMLDGPARPSIRVQTRTYRREAGTDATRNYDPSRVGYQPVGWQDGSATRIWGGSPGYFQPYAQRGTSESVARDTSGNAMLPSTVPHGLHTHSVRGTVFTARVYDGTPQMRGTRQDRISNSTRAGQSYSQTTVVQGGS